MFLPRSWYAPNMILIRKTFQYTCVTKILPNQDLTHSQLRAGFGPQIISHMNIHSQSNLKFIIFNAGTQNVLDLQNEL